MSENRNWIKYGAAFGFVAVAMGAFGAHALQDILTEQYASVYNTASKYALVHAVLLIALSLCPEIPVPRAIFIALVLGIAIFSGTLWGLAIFQIKWLGAITPIGGLCLLFAWAHLGWWGFRM